MRYIENLELREWVKDNLRKTIFQKAHALAIQTGCEILVKLKDTTDITTGQQYYANGTLQKAYHNNGLRKLPDDMFVSGETGHPLIDQGIQSGESIGLGLPDTSSGGNVGRVPKMQQDAQVFTRLITSPSTNVGVATGSVAGKDSDPSFPTGSSSIHSQSTSSVQTRIGVSPGNFQQPTDFDSTVETMEYGPECARDNPIGDEGDEDIATRIKVEPPDDTEDSMLHSVISSDDGTIGVDTKTESMSDDVEDHFGQSIDDSSFATQTSFSLPPDAAASQDLGTMSQMEETYHQDSQTTSAASGSSSKPYQCAVCHKAFRSIQVLQKHTQTMHRRGKGRVFPRGSRSRGGSGGKRGGRQQRAHTEVAGPSAFMHVCTICNQRFSESILLNDHIVRAHLTLDPANPSTPFSLNPETVPLQFANAQADPQLPQITSVSSLQYPVNPMSSTVTSAYSQSPMAAGPSHSAGSSSQGQGKPSSGKQSASNVTSAVDIFIARSAPTADIFTPRIISMPEVGKFHLGGNPKYVRSIQDYKAVLKRVSCYHKYHDNDYGRLLCTTLFRQEFSKEDLLTKNVTGFTRNDSKKIIQMPKLDQELLSAIFEQARHQFPGFTDLLTDTSSKTVRSLNSACKQERQVAAKELAIKQAALFSKQSK